MTVPPDAEVTSGTPLASIQPPGFHIRLPVTDPAALYSFVSPPHRGRAQIIGGPAGFPVRFERTVHQRDSDQVTVYVALPKKIRAFAGLHAVVVFVTATRSMVPTLPNSAVQGHSGNGEIVTLNATGKHHVTQVRIGAADGDYVEVSGVPEGMTVLLYPLNSDFVH